MKRPNIYAELYDRLIKETNQYKKGWIDTAETAKIIRYELSIAFPGHKFSVRIDRYSGGSSIDVNWTDGPTESAVNKVIGYLESKGFDGMIDLSYYHNHYLTRTGLVYGGTPGTVGSAGSDPAIHVDQPPDSIKVSLGGSYLFTNRHYSPELTAQIIKDYNDDNPGIDITPEQWDQGRVYDRSHYHWIGQAFREHDAYTPPAPRQPTPPTQPTQPGFMPAGYTIEYERDWTWITFAEKPAQDIIEKIKELGGRWAFKRRAWYIKQHIDALPI